MDGDLQRRVAVLYTPVKYVMESFSERSNEPFVEDNMYMAVVGVIQQYDPTLLNDLCPEIVFEHDGTNIFFKVFYHRVH